MTAWEQLEMREYRARRLLTKKELARRKVETKAETSARQLAELRGFIDERYRDVMKEVTEREECRVQKEREREDAIHRYGYEPAILPW